MGGHFASLSRALRRRPSSRTAFTLFELVVAVALSAALLMLVAAAINLYLLECDADRMRVEQAQLARAVLGMIAEDIRGTYVHEPREFSALSQEISTAASSSDEESGAGGSPGAPGSPGGPGGGSGADGGGAGGGSSGSSGGERDSQPGTPDSQLVPSPGVYGTLGELVLDIMRMPSPREQVPRENGQPMSAVRSVRWFVREGQRVPATSLATTSLSPEEQLRVGGLVRQEVDRAARVRSSQSDDSILINQPGELVAPEVVALEFRFFSGTEILETWDTNEMQALPRAIEVRLFVNPPTVDASKLTGRQELIGPETLQYTLTVELPMVTSATDAAAEEPESNSTTSGGM